MGDFGKYGLLRALTAEGDNISANLGVVWYLVSDELHNNDGRHIAYLMPTERNADLFQSCDTHLYDALSGIIRNNARSVDAVRCLGILPADTAFYDAVMDGKTGLLRPGAASRETQRWTWVKGALATTEDCDLVFLDPDNGLLARPPQLAKSSVKYAFYDELAPYVQRGQTLIVYHHTSRRGTAREQVRCQLLELKRRLDARIEPFALLYHRGSSRAFLIIPAAKHVQTIKARVDGLLQTPWCRHFELLQPSTDTRS